MERKESKILIQYLEKQLKLHTYNKSEKQGYLKCIEEIKKVCPTENEFKIFEKECPNCHFKLDFNNHKNMERQPMVTNIGEEISNYVYWWYIKCPKCNKKILFGKEEFSVDMNNLLI